MQKHAHESGQISYDESTGLPLDPKMVADALKEQLMFMRTLQVYHEVLVSFLDKSGLKAIGTRWVYTNKCDAADPFIRDRLVAQESKQDASSTFAATPPLESLKFMASRCMIGMKVEGFCDFGGAHFHSPGRRTIVIKVPRDDQCTSGYAFLDKAMCGTRDAAQCFDVASENAMTAMGYDTGKFSPCLYHSTAVAMSVCPDTATTLWCRAREHNKRSFRNSCLIISSSSILQHWDRAQHVGDVTEVRILNSLVRWVKPPYGTGRERIEYEANPRYA